MKRIVGVHTNSGYYLYDLKLKYILNIDELKFKIFNILNHKKEHSDLTTQELIDLQDEVSYHPSRSIIKEDIRFIAEILKENSVIEHEEEYQNITEQEIIQSISNVKHIVIELTRECNLYCSYCCNNDMYVHRWNPVISDINLDNCLQAVKTLLNYQHSSNNLYNLHTIYISFYGGEPLLKMSYIEKIVTYLKQEFPTFNFIFSFTTNGLLLKEYILKLIKSNFFISVSIDGDRENNVYRSFKNGKESFDIVYQHVLYIKNKFPHFYRNNIKFISVLHDKTDIIKLCNFFKGLNKVPELTPYTKVI